VIYWPCVSLSLSLSRSLDLESVATSVTACARVLLGERLPPPSAPWQPCASAVAAIEATRAALAPYWPVLRSPTTA
jgi:hypothetical protein